jgi:hypothetical protein
MGMCQHLIEEPLRDLIRRDSLLVVREHGIPHDHYAQTRATAAPEP